jgi:hypothetical protein
MAIVLAESYALLSLGNFLGACSAGGMAQQASNRHLNVHMQFG